MELYEFHILYGAFGTVDHGDSVSGGDERIGSVTVNGFTTACSHDGYFGKEGIYLTGIFIQHVGTVAFDARCVAGHDDAQMVLGNDFHRIVVGQYRDVGMLFDGFYQAGLYFCSCIVFMVQNPELGMPAFFMQVKFSIVFFVKRHSPFDELIDLSGCVAHHFLYGFAVAYPVARNHSVLNMFFKIIYCQIGDRGNASLSEIGVCFF